MLGFLTMMAWMAGVGPDPTVAARDIKVPILIELFTSEGCSSCPPADAWLQQLDRSQPIAGAQVIVLSEHVDYWDHDGWKDPYSSPVFTDRQNGYVHNLGISSPYTPQVIVDGHSELRLNEPKQVSDVLLKAEKSVPVPVTISTIHVEGSAPGILHAHVEADGSTAIHSADIYAALALDHAESQVLHGENGGRRLTHVAVVEQLKKIGKLEKGKIFSQDIQESLKPGMDSMNLRLIVFVQQPELGNVLGAAQQGIEPSNK